MLLEYYFSVTIIVIADIDECSLGLCDKQTTSCNNTIGSFVCNCQYGYTPGNDKTFCEGWNTLHGFY